MKVLIVEDEALIALGYADVVERMGHRVVGLCASLEGAREIASEDPPDLGLVDLRLGRKRCGASVDAYLHDSFGTTSVYITANPDFARRYRTRAIGYAEKPLPTRALEAVIRYLAAVHEGRTDVVPPPALCLFAGPVAGVALADGAAVT